MMAGRPCISDGWAAAHDYTRASVMTGRRDISADDSPQDMSGGRISVTTAEKPVSDMTGP